MQLCIWNEKAMSTVLSQSPKTETVDATGPLFEQHPKIHPKQQKGFYRSIKSALLWGFLLLYHFSPWIRWDRGVGNPDQAILFDIGGKRIYLFSLEIWPQDIYILTGMMIFAAVGLFLAAALWGRAWCGFGCFQTIWTDLFMHVESWVEGDRNARIRLDRAPLTFNKLVKRSLKHSIWLLISAFFALSFLWYFGDAKNVTVDLFLGQLDGWSLATFATLLVMTYVMAGFAREQVCLYMCPYGRFQGVMFDAHSKVITYEDWRGEGRQKPGKNRDFTDRGHCVDCTLCVQVCPTGIDIREGQQMGCIGCGLCIDACNDVMEKFDLPKNLISYDSQVNIAARAAKKDVNAKAVRSKLIQPRTYIYSGILLITVLVTAFALNSRSDTELSILKDRSPFFVQLSSGQVQNAYTLRILNKAKTPKTYRLDVEASNFPDFSIIGTNTNEIQLDAGSVATLRMIVKGHTSDYNNGKTPLSVILHDLEKDKITIKETVFHGPK